MHSKVVIIDQGKRTSISSVNFSKTSFTKNREAGVVIEGCSCPALDLYQSVFQYDWDNGFDYKLDANYSAHDLAIIKDSAPIDIPSITYPKIPGAYVTKKTTYKGVMVTKGYTAPDGARNVIMSDLTDVKSSLQVCWQKSPLPPQSFPPPILGGHLPDHRHWPLQSTAEAVQQRGQCVHHCVCQGCVLH